MDETRSRLYLLLAIRVRDLDLAIGQETYSMGQAKDIQDRILPFPLSIGSVVYGGSTTRNT
jgi:hypothetical protein